MVKNKKEIKSKKTLNFYQKDQLSKYFSDLSKGLLVVVATVLFSNPEDYLLYLLLYLLLAGFLVYLSMYIMKGESKNG